MSKQDNNKSTSEQIKELREESRDARIENNCSRIEILKVNPK